MNLTCCIFSTIVDFVVIYIYIFKGLYNEYYLSKPFIVIELVKLVSLRTFDGLKLLQGCHNPECTIFWF